MVLAELKKFAIDTKKLLREIGSSHEAAIDFLFPLDDCFVGEVEMARQAEISRRLREVVLGAGELEMAVYEELVRLKEEQPQIYSKMTNINWDLRYSEAQQFAEELKKHLQEIKSSHAADINILFPRQNLPTQSEIERQNGLHQRLLAPLGTANLETALEDELNRLKIEQQDLQQSSIPNKAEFCSMKEYEFLSS